MVVDSSVWIDHLNGRATKQTAQLKQCLDDEDLPIIVGDIIMYEVLCGFREARAALEVKAMLERRLLVSMLGFDLVYGSVGNYRALRAKGITIKAADVFIGTYCIVSGAQLLASDSDFLAMRDQLGLRMVE
jgi:predicted nucleic acid-binding protein